MTTQEYLCRHFARMGARVVVRGPRLRQRTKIAIDVGRDRSGEVFVIGCEEEVAIEVLDVQPQLHHLVLMVREGSDKHKFLLGRDERHWFAAAVPGDSVRDVRTAIASLRPTETEGREAIRQGEWFFVPEPGVNDKDAVILRNEPLSRGAGSKPHVCEQMMRKGGEVVMVSRAYPTGLSLASYHELIATNEDARRFGWRQMVRDAAVYALGEIRHKDHKTVDLWCWHRVYMNRERFAKHAPQIGVAEFTSTLPGDSSEFMKKVQELVVGVARDYLPARLYVIRIDNWFGPKWMHFAGKFTAGKGFAIGVHKTTLHVPPFVPHRVVAERVFAGPNFEEEVIRPPLHIECTSELAPHKANR